MGASRLVAAVTLGLALALVTVQYTAMHGLLFRALPFDPTGRMVDVRWSAAAPRSQSARPRLHELRALRRVSQSFQSLTGYSVAHVGHSVRLADGRWIQREGLAVLPGLLEAIGARLQLGRPFLPEDFRPGAAEVVIISQGLWLDLGGDARVVGSKLYFDRRDHVVVGVAAGPAVDGETFWTPSTEDSALLGRDTGSPLEVLGTLAPGVTVRQASAELARFTAAELELPPELVARLGRLEAVPVRTGLTEPGVLQFYGMMFGSVLLVLFCACANVSNLLLARAAARVHELAVRACLGATRGRLVRQLVRESLGTGLAAAVIGLAVAALLSGQARLQRQIVPLPPWVTGELDWAAAAVVAAIGLGASTLAALLPALRASRLDLHALLKDDPRTSSALNATRATSFLQGAQIAVSTGVLLVACSLALTVHTRAARRLRLDPRAYLGTALVFPRDEFRSEEQVRSVVLALDRRLRELPGGLRGAVSSRPGLAPGREVSIKLRPGAEQTERVHHAQVGLSYFAALGATLLEGRPFDEGDSPDRPRVAIVDATFVDRFWRGQSAVGRVLVVPGPDDRDLEVRVVGVVPSLHMGGAASDRPEAASFFTPLAQMDRRTGVYPFVTGPASAGLEKTLAAVVRAADPERPPRRMRTFQAELDAQQSGLRVFQQLFGMFGLCALVLSATGLYGIFALGVRQRVREIGTRMALGASAGRIVLLFVGRSARQLAIGLAAGGALGALLLVAIERRLGPLGSPWPALLLTAGTVAAVCLAATLGPAVRGARLSPLAALRDS